MYIECCRFAVLHNKYGKYFNYLCTYVASITNSSKVKLNLVDKAGQKIGADCILECSGTWE